MPEVEKLESGNWTGFYLEPHNPNRGWMNLYLVFSTDGSISGEGTDYVGPWQARGEVNSATKMARWTKQYLGKHRVQYEGKVTPRGIEGNWAISSWLAGPFHIWPVNRGDIQAEYLADETRG